MKTHKRKKATRLRGSHTHGWGAKKKHRGKGSRGGIGMAGTGKRAGHKIMKIAKLYGKNYLGKKGFKDAAKKINVVNLSYLEEHIDKITKKEAEFFTVDVSKLGYDKVLGTGNLTKKFKVISKSFSKSAIDKIKKAGGEAVKI